MREERRVREGTSPRLYPPRLRAGLRTPSIPRPPEPPWGRLDAVAAGEGPEVEGRHVVADRAAGRLLPRQDGYLDEAPLGLPAAPAWTAAVASGESSV